jgi:hypothetical protein
MEQFDAIVPSRPNTNKDGYVSVARPWSAFSPSSSSASSPHQHNDNNDLDGYDADLDFDPSMSISSRRAASAQRRRLCVYGAFAGVFVVFVVVLSVIHQSSSSSAAPRTKQEPNHGQYDTSSKTPFAFTARHPLAGEYHDVVVLSIREDISSLLPPSEEEEGGGDQPPEATTEITTIVETTKTVQDLQQQQQQKQWDIVTTRLRTDTQIMGMVTHCDTQESSPPLACAALAASAGMKMSFVIAANGTVVSEVDTDAHGHITKNARTTAGAPDAVQTVDNNLQYLPLHPVNIGDEWESRFELSNVGDYVGRTTLAGTTPCDAPSASSSASSSSSSSSKKKKNSSSSSSTCAVLTSSGAIYMDVRAMADRFGSIGIDPSMLSIVDGTVSITLYWNDPLAYFAYLEAQFDFTIQITFPGDPVARIPVHERITQTTTLQSAPQKP